MIKRGSLHPAYNRFAIQCQYILQLFCISFFKASTFVDHHVFLYSLCLHWDSNGLASPQGSLAFHLVQSLSRGSNRWINLLFCIYTKSSRKQHFNSYWVKLLVELKTECSKSCNLHLCARSMLPCEICEPKQLHITPNIWIHWNLLTFLPPLEP